MLRGVRYSVPTPHILARTNQLSSIARHQVYSGPLKSGAFAADAMVPIVRRLKLPSLLADGLAERTLKKALLNICFY